MQVYYLLFTILCNRIEVLHDRVLDPRQFDPDILWYIGGTILRVVPDHKYVLVFYTELFYRLSFALTIVILMNQTFVDVGQFVNLYSYSKQIVCFLG